MDEDSVLRATIVADDVADIFNITFQALPRVQTTFRYTIFNPRDLDGSVDILRDRSYAVKALLWEEGELVPQAAIGVRDILGTGAWEGEYFVVSKKTGAFDWSLGMGWGPLCGKRRV